jgi:hypothetical protein
VNKTGSDPTASMTFSLKKVMQQVHHPLFVNSLFILSNQLLFAFVGMTCPQ